MNVELYRKVAVKLQFENLSDWIDIGEGCFVRVKHGGNPYRFADRVAFACGQFGRVRVHRHAVRIETSDHVGMSEPMNDAWIIEDSGTNNTSQANRLWCDIMLTALGWE